MIWQQSGKESQVLELAKIDRKKEWLERYLIEKKELELLDEQYKELVSIQESTGSIEYTGMPSGSGDLSDLSKFIVAREKIIEKYIEQRYKKTLIGDEIITTINQLPTIEERKVMTYRYIQGLAWEKICVKMNKSWTQVVGRLHSQALENLIIPENEEKK